jgi:hypothetical protein
MALVKCDYDGARLPPGWWQRVGMACRFHGLRVEYVRIDRTRNGWHVVIAVKQRVALMRLVLVQALCGSDWKRELFNSRRALVFRHTSPFWRKRANVLYSRHLRGVEL